MSLAAEQAEHAARVVGILWLAEDLTLRQNDRVRSNHNGAFTGGARWIGNGTRLGLRHSPNVILGGFVRLASFVNIRWTDLKNEARVAENFRAARRRGCEDQFHRGPLILIARFAAHGTDAHAATASTFVQPNRRASCVGDARGCHSRNFAASLLRASFGEMCRAAAV